MRVHRYQKVRNIADSELIFVGGLIVVATLWAVAFLSTFDPGLVGKIFGII